MRSEGPIAAVDCGTNSTRLLVVDAGGAPLVRLMRITRLGQGVDATGRLAPEAIERTVAVLEEFRRDMDRLGVVGGRMAATSAAREAVNGADFLAAATRTVGIDAELLSGEEEGRLAYLGATASLPPAEGDDVVVDIGGGSTELMVEREGIGVHSMAIGCVRLTERCLVHDPPTPDEIVCAVTTVQEQLDRALAAVPALGDLRRGGRLIGLAGTVSTLAMLVQGLDDYDRDRIHHSWLRFDQVDRWCRTLLAETTATRAERPAVVEGREDVIAGGALVLREVMLRLGFDRCLVSEDDILDGLALSVRV